MYAEQPDGTLPFKSIGELLSYRFLVKDYQRGYKWTRQEVIDLLDDIDDFARRYPQDDAPNAFYCLQPVIVQRLAEPADRPSYELIDGQQRFTTIYLILACLRDLGATEQQSFQLQYETREGSAGFLSGIAKAGITPELEWPVFLQRPVGEGGLPVDNIDNFHFFEAYQAIVKWFGPLGSSSPRAAFCRTLLDRCRVIWYEPKSGASAEEIFVRLNSGKIPLTPAELIKALFLQERPPTDAVALPPHRLRELAHQWDQIEYTLQGDAFWGFINKATDKREPVTRIDFLFDLASKRKDQSDPKHSFRHYAKLVKEEKFGPETEWKEVQSRFQYLREWYDDPGTYHLLGFVITRGWREVAELLETAKKLNKTAFAESIRQSIHAGMSKYEPLDALQFEEHKEELHSILLLFNLRTILDSRSATRFPFDRYREITRSLEHIHAQKSEKLSPRENLGLWYEDYRRRLVYLEGDRVKELREEFEQWRQQYALTTEKSTDSEITALEKASAILDRTFGTRLDEMNANRPLASNLRKLTHEQLHGLGNLALLGRDENAALNNSIFADKRREVIAMNNRGKFIPDATKNVFLKYYSREDAPRTDLWGPLDCQSYLDAIGTALAPFGVRKTASL